MKSHYTHHTRDEPDHADTLRGTTLPLESAVLCEKSQQQYEILPGLWALGVIMTKTPLANSFDSETNTGKSFDHSSSYQLSICSDVITLVDDEDPIPIARMTNLFLSATVVVSKGTTTLQNLSVTIEHVVLNPLADENRLKRFLERYGSTVDEQIPRCRTSTSNSSFINSKNDDISIPRAQVHAIRCTIRDNVTVPFPNCVGTPTCTLRVLVDYYVKSLLQVMDEPSKAGVNLATATSDVTSVAGSVTGAAVGTLFLGPVGWVAGSFYGAHLGRKHSRKVVGGVVGGALFGPVGLVAGAACSGKDDGNGEPRPREKTVTITSANGSSARASVRDHLSSKKYQYAGTTGVTVGGVAAGALLGPVGIVAGGLAGALSGRKIVEKVSERPKEEDKEATVVAVTEGNGNVKGNKTPRMTQMTRNSANITADNKPYRFGDKTRGLIAKGKHFRGVHADKSYKFGDFTRGLFS